VRIGGKLIGDGHPCFIIAEIGINHNGDIDLARRLISVAVATGCDAVKFQKRTVDVVYSAEELAKPRENPFGATNGDLKRGLEFGQDEYRLIDHYCREVKMMWFASCWDEQAVDFIDQFDPPCYKIASASLTDDNLLRHTRPRQADHLSTGMSTVEEIDHAVEVLGKKDLVLLHACSVYPAHYPELNLRAITTLRERYRLPVGIPGMKRACPPRWLPWLWAPAASNATSRSTAPCGGPTRPLRSSPTAFPKSSATCALSSSPWAMGSSAWWSASSRLSRSCGASE